MARISITAPVTIYYDPVRGSDSNDGTSPTSAYKTLQCAMDHASSDFDFAAPFSWQKHIPGSTASGIGNVGYRQGVTIQMAPVSFDQAEQLVDPVFLDGHGQSCPIYLRGDPTSRASILAHNIRVENVYQGLTAQHGAHLICDGFTVHGTSTIFNPLQQGAVSVRNIFCNAAGFGGAPAQAILNVIGKITLMGSGMVAVFAAIENGMINFAPGAEVSFDNAMDYGVMFALQKGQVWTQGTPIIWSGPGLPRVTGQPYVATWASIIGINADLIPGSRPGFQDETSVILRGF